MCLLDYDFAILSNAFLIHRPGIKSSKDTNNIARKDKNRQSAQTALINNIIMSELRHLYGTPKNCSYDYMGNVRTFDIA